MDNMEQIKIKKTNNPELGYENKDELLKDTEKHIYDVGRVLTFLGNELITRGEKHDWSKLEYFNDFAQDTLERKDTPDFKSRKWYKIHTVKERHHVNANTPTDVDLIDILEMIVDCIVSGKSRMDYVNPYFLILKNDTLEKAYWNTVKKLEEKIIVE